MEEVIHLRNRQKVMELNLLSKSRAKCVRIAFQFHPKRLKLLVCRKIFQAQRTTWKGTFNDELIQMYSFVNIGPFWKTHWNDTHLFLIQLLINESSVAIYFFFDASVQSCQQWGYDQNLEWKFYGIIALRSFLAKLEAMTHEKMKKYYSVTKLDFMGFISALNF